VRQIHLKLPYITILAYVFSGRLSSHFFRSFVKNDLTCPVVFVAEKPYFALEITIYFALAYNLAITKEYKRPVA
jgi:hypothetical protein